MARRFWLVKTEPTSFSWDDLWKSPKRTTFWNGVRNYQARNLLRDEMHVGDGVLVYHSNADPSAVIGAATVVKAGYPDPTQFDATSKYFDADATPDAPRWFMVDIKADRRLARPLPLDELRGVPPLRGMELLRKGSRLSVQPVSAAEWKAVLKLGGLA